MTVHLKPIEKGFHLGWGWRVVPEGGARTTLVDIWLGFFTLELSFTKWGFYDD